jgi:hypothetical protein
VHVTLGFRPHTGWAVAVAVGGDLASPEVVERRVIALTDQAQVPAQVYHAAVELEPRAAEALVRKAERVVAQVTEREVTGFVTELRSNGYLPLAAGVATTAAGPKGGFRRADRGQHSNVRPSNVRPSNVRHSNVRHSNVRHSNVAYVLAAHMRMHAAEGELYGEAIADALDEAGLPVTLVHPRDVAASAADGLGRDAGSLQRMVTAIGASLGPPWRKDEKEATLLAWTALADLERRDNDDPPIYGRD